MPAVLSGFILAGCSRSPGSSSGSSSSPGSGSSSSISSSSSALSISSSSSQALAFKVTYISNGTLAGGSVPADTNSYMPGAKVTVLSNSNNMAMTGYAFAGWTTSINGPGTSYDGTGTNTFSMPSSNISLFAVWITNSLTFTSSGKSIIITGTNASVSGTLTIPCGVTGIGNSAFWNCFSISNVIIPASVVSYNLWAFQVYPFFTVASGNLYYQSDNSGVLFNKGKTVLLEVPRSLSGSYAVPSSVTNIGDNSFYATFYLTNITIPFGVIRIGSNVFNNCDSLTNLVIPSSVLIIGSGVVYYSPSLTYVTIPSSVTNIGPAPFQSCPKLTNIIVDPANSYYKSDSSGVLFNKSKTSIIQAPGGLSGNYTIPPGIINIGFDAFADISTLTGLGIPSSVSNIDVQAIEGCTSLTSVTIPASITNIGFNGFYYDSALTNVTIQAGTPPSLGGNAFNNCSAGLLIHVPAGCVTAYTNAPGWISYSNIIVTP